MTTPLRLLIVEDSEDDALLEVRELERAGYAPDYKIVETPTDLRAALDEASWDAVITDYHLPELDGLEALHIISENGRDLPVIIVSGAIGEDVAVNAMLSGAHDYVMKDNLARLPAAVQRELEEADGRRARRAAEAALRASEARYRAVVEDQTDLVVRWLPDGTLNFVNRSCCDFFGKPWGSLVGTNLYDFVVAADRPKVRAKVASLSPEDPVASAEHRVIKPDGTAAWQEWVDRGIFDGSGRMVELQSVGRDVTERHRAEDAERQQRLLVEVLRDTAQVLNSTLDLDEVFDRILANIGWVIPHDAAAIFFVEGSDARVIRLRGWEERGVDDVPGAVALTAIEKVALAAMVKSGKPIVIHDTSADSRWRPGARRIDWVRSFAAAPLSDQAKVLGVIALFSATPGHFSPTHMELLEGFASHSSTATRNARLFEEASRGRQQLKKLSAQLVDAQEEERRRISRELHDEVGQTLTVLIMNADFVTGHFEKDCPPLVHERLQEITSLARQTLDQIRSLSYRLRPAMLDELGLAPTVQWLSERFSDRMGIALDLEIDLVPDERLDSVLETTLYRAVQEALTNVAKHAEASTVTVSLKQLASSVALYVEDDGKGIGAQKDLSRTQATGLGLVGMRERVSHLGGELLIAQPPAGGTRLSITIPIEAQ